MRYQRRNDQHFDFLIDVNSCEQVRALMERLGAKCIHAKNNTVYLFAHVLPDNITSGYFFSGHIICSDGSYLSGPTVLTKAPNGNGNWTAISLGKRGIEVFSDAFGSIPTYYNSRFVSNNLYLIYLSMQNCNKASISKTQLLSSFIFQHALGDQAFSNATPIEGVHVLGPQDKITIRNEINLTRSHRNLSPITSREEYASLIKKGASEVVANIEATIKHFPNTRSAITGGRDSRAVYAALVAAGLQEAVSYYTLPIGRDAEIAEALLSKFGGDFDQTTQKRAIVEDLDHSFEKFQSTNLFQDHRWDKHVKEVFYDDLDSFAHLGGGSGEVYRGFYHKQISQIESIEQENSISTTEAIAHFISLSSNDSILELDITNGNSGSIISEMQGETVARKLLNHYSAFRNRLHFATSPHNFNKKDISPLKSAALLELSSRCSDDVVLSGRITHDLIKELCPELAVFEYDKDNFPNFPESGLYDTEVYHGFCFAKDVDVKKHIPRSVRSGLAARIPDRSNVYDWCLARLIPLIGELSRTNEMVFSSDAAVSKCRWLHENRKQNLFKYFSIFQMSYFYMSEGAIFSPEN